jgi:2-oxoglutarate dehydrogenase E2 component (dihydrolipoamide succinyltransferase)
VTGYDTDMAQLVDVTLPEQSEGTEFTVGSWFKKAGEGIAANEPLLEIITDKVTMEVAAPAAGVVREILKKEGDKVEPGEVLGRIEEGAVAGARPTVAAPAATRGASVAMSPATAGGASAELSPAVRRMLSEHALDAAQINGTGRGGRITVQDVEAFLASGGAAAIAAPPPPAAADATRVASGAGARGTQSAIPSRMVPHTPMRRSIAQHMVQSMLQTAPHVTTVFDADLSAVLVHRDANKTGFESRGAKLTFTPYFVLAAVAALKAVPEANSRWHDDALEIYEDYNIGVATALGDGGLIVPVVRKAQELDLFGIAQRVNELAGKARSNSLDPKDVQHGTFTISNHGMTGSLVATPIIINQPQSAILGIGKLERRPLVIESNGKESIEIRPMAYVTLTIDHRVLDGYTANKWMNTFVETLTNWR